MTLSNPTSKVIILGLTLFAFFLRIYRLEAQSYWIDEAWTLFFIKLPIQELLRLLQTEEPKPPFYYLTTYQWVRFFGDGEFALRYYSVIFGTITIPLVYRLGKALADKWSGLISAFLMVISPYQIWHSQDARMYSIFTAASVMSMWGFVNLWKKGGWRWWLVYVIGTEWAITTHYHAVVIIGIQGLFLLLTWRRHWRGYLAWASTLLLILLIYLPWLALGGSLLQSFLHWVKQPDTLWETYSRGVLAYSVGELVPYEQALPLTLIFILLYGFGLFYVTRRSWGIWHGSEMLAFLLAYTLAPNIAAWLYGEFRTTVYLERYLIPVQVGYLLTISLGILAIVDGIPVFIQWLQTKRGKRNAPPWPGLLLATLILLGLLSINGWVLHQHYTNPAYAKPNWRGVIQTIEAHSLPDDAILMTGDGGEKLFNFYYQGDLPVYTNFNTPVPSTDQAQQQLAEIAGKHQRLWYTPYGVDIDSILESWLMTNSHPAWQSWLGRKRLALYGLQANPQREEATNVHFVDSTGQGPQLQQVTLPNHSTPAGDVLPLTLTWQTNTPLIDVYQISLRLVNTRGDIFTQSDWPPLASSDPPSSWPLNHPITDQRSLWIPADTPPGDYALQLVIYNPQTGQGVGEPYLINNIPIKPANTIVPPEALAIPNFTTTFFTKPFIALKPVGFVPPTEIRPGDETWLWLYWLADGMPDPNTTVRLSLEDNQENIVSEEYPLETVAGPLELWQPGQIRKTVYHFSTKPALTGEAAELYITLYRNESQISPKWPIAKIKLITRPRQFDPPAGPNQIGAIFRQPPALTLLGYNLPSPTLNSEPKTLNITLHWQALTEMDTNYTVFIQLLNEAGEVVAQIDRQPLNGEAPTTTWLPNEFLTDSYALTLPTDLAAGEYRLITGLYNAANGQRLSLATSGDFVELESITVQ